MRFWLGLSFLLVFAAGVATGGLASLEIASSPAYTDTGPLIALSGDVPIVTSQAVYRELGLDEAQRERLDAIIARHYGELRKIRASLHTLWSNLREGIRGVLTPQQRELFDEIQLRYGEEEIEMRVLHRLSELRQELHLEPEQEPTVYQVLYDAALAGRELWRKRSRRDDPRAMREKWIEILEDRDAFLLDFLGPEQGKLYRELREREKRLWSERHDRRRRKNGHGPRGDDRHEGEKPPKHGGPPPRAE